MRDLARALGDMGFPDRLERIDSLRILFADLHHFAETALADDFEKIESFDRQRLVPGLFEIDFEMEGARARGCVVPLVGCML